MAELAVWGWGDGMIHDRFVRTHATPVFMIKPDIYNTCYTCETLYVCGFACDSQRIAMTGGVMQTLEILHCPTCPLIQIYAYNDD